MFFVLVTVLFVIYVIIFSRSINTYGRIRASHGSHNYEKLHITKKHTQTNVSYPVMDISCMPSRAGCIDLEVEGVRYIAICIAGRRHTRPASFNGQRS